MTNRDRTKVLDRVKKLLALGRSPEPHEAAAALQRAQELMAKHGVTVAMVEGPVSEPIASHDVKSIATATRVKGWEFRLLRTVADAFGCELLWISAYPYGRYRVLGYESEVEVAVYTAQVLLRQLRAAKNRFVKTLDSAAPRTWKASEADAYCTGWVHGASENVQRLVDAKVAVAREADPTGATTLRVQTDEEKRAAAVRLELERLTTGASKSQGRRRRGSSHAKARGVADGRRATVQRAVGGSTDGKELRS